MRRIALHAVPENAGQLRSAVADAEDGVVGTPPLNPVWGYQQAARDAQKPARDSAELYRDVTANYLLPILWTLLFVFGLAKILRLNLEKSRGSWWVPFVAAIFSSVAIAILVSASTSSTWTLSNGMLFAVLMPLLYEIVVEVPSFALYAAHRKKGGYGSSYVYAASSFACCALLSFAAYFAAGSLKVIGGSQIILTFILPVSILLFSQFKFLAQVSLTKAASWQMQKASFLQRVVEFLVWMCWIAILVVSAIIFLIDSGYFS